MNTYICSWAGGGLNYQLLTKVIFRVYLIQFLHINEFDLGVYIVSKFAHRA